MLLQTAFNTLIPHELRSYLFHLIRKWFFKPHPNGLLTLVFDDNSSGGYARNEIYDAAEAYLATKISNKADCLRVTKTPGNKNLILSFEDNEKIYDEFKGVDLSWRFHRNTGSDPNKPTPEKRCFHLTLPKQDKDLILGSYIPFIIETVKRMRNNERVLKIHTIDRYSGGKWTNVNLKHPATFDTLAMEPSLKEAVIADMERFRCRKDFYKRVGRAWKRGYLLYGPPGTGKSSLIASMANYMKFDIYDLQLSSISDDSELRRVLLATANRSILVIEDIDCGGDLPDRKTAQVCNNPKFWLWLQITLSGLLNFIDGLWSSCGDERIIVFTTNHKDRLDSALLRPGRMDMHIHMSYCTSQGLKVLVQNYLGRDGGTHKLYGEIERLIEDAQVTPAQVAEKLMTSDDADVALDELLNFLMVKGGEATETTKTDSEIDEECD
ncbi:unnamed protein product [Linum tenue]|uniref:AAA+ ATPase domain-containing protein n=1 Tax=Linum tenue TaxID=586396 RepID=A0AAV0I6Y0_9ROSI|nr:unnamed protein product [Linum tenue]